MSAAAQLQGIYEGSGPEIPTGISNDLTVPPFSSSIIDEINSKVNVTNVAIGGGFQPIPIHSSDLQFDYLLQSFLRCPNLDGLYRKHVNDEKAQKMYGEFAEVIEFLKTKDIEIKNMKDLKEIADVALASKYYGKELPGGIAVDSSMYKDLEFAASWFDIYPIFAQTIQKQIFAAPMFSDLIDYIDGIRDESSKTRVVLWSGTEASLFSLLIALDVINFECLEANWKSQRAGEAVKYPNCVYPGFASSLIFEFYNQTENPFVVFRYSDQEVSICGENKNCTLSEFKDLVNRATDNNKLKGYYKVCGVPEDAQLGNNGDIHSEKMYSKELVFCMGAIIALLIIIVAVLLAKRQNSSDSRQQSDKGKSLLKDSTSLHEEL